MHSEKSEGDQSLLPHATLVSLPRPNRRPRKAKVDRGLPPDEEIVKLSQVYLERQRKLWPTLVEAGVLPVTSDELVQEMVSDFKDRHRTGVVAVESVKPFQELVKNLAGAYARYSCDNSSTNSILDQLVKILDAAAKEERFIPWPYVFADYSVTGLDASRRGYSSFKQILNDKAHFLDVTFIDDFTRASPR